MPPKSAKSTSKAKKAADDAAADAALDAAIKENAAIPGTEAHRLLTSMQTPAPSAVIGGTAAAMSNDTKTSKHPDGYDVTFCRHDRELCDTCCMDFTAMNQFSRQDHHDKLAKLGRTLNRGDRRAAGCGNPDCQVGKQSDAKTLPKIPLVCGGCKQICYCSAACQKAHWASHREPCRSSRPTCRDADGKTVFAHLVGDKVEQLVDGKPTGFICEISSLDTMRNSYVLKVCLDRTPIFREKATNVGHGPYLDHSDAIQPAIPNQTWRMWYGNNDGSPFPMMGISFNPYGRGPYVTGSVFEKHLENRPTGLLACIIGTEPKLTSTPDGNVAIPGNGGLSSLTYVMRHCGYYTDSFERKCQVVHAF